MPLLGAARFSPRTWFVSDTWLAAFTRTTLVVLFLFVIWDLVARWLVQNRLILVPPLEVASALIVEAKNGALLSNTYFTFFELAFSFPIAVLVGVLVGTLLASSRVVGQTFEPILTALNAVPVVALAPLFIAWLGFGLASKFAIIVLVSIFSVIITTEVGLRSTDPIFVEAARSFNATKTQIFWTVTLPFAIPFIIGGIRVAFARSLVGVIVAEFFGSLGGYGFAILAASQSFDTAGLLGYVMLLGLIGMAGSIGLRAWEHHLAPWREL